MLTVLRIVYALESAAVSKPFCVPMTRGAATADENQHLRFRCLRTFNCGTSSVNCVRFFGDADHLLAGASDRKVYLLGAQHGVLHEFSGGQPVGRRVPRGA